MTSSPVRFPQNWIAAARYERDRRAEKSPQLVASGKLDEELATLDYQAWCAIAEWLERGKASWPAMVGLWGGVADPLQTVISWALLEERAARQLEALDSKLSAAARDPAAAAKLPALRDRRDAIWCIHNLLVKQRELIEPTLREETAWARPPLAVPA